jgi:hypothetical protein
LINYQQWHQSTHGIANITLSSLLWIWYFLFAWCDIITLVCWQEYTTYGIADTTISTFHLLNDLFRSIRVKYWTKYDSALTLFILRQEERFFKNYHFTFFFFRIFSSQVFFTKKKNRLSFFLFLKYLYTTLPSHEHI